MIQLERWQVLNMENALRGARNPLSSWDKSDSFTDEQGVFHIGEADMTLAKKLCAAGSDHRKFLRQIFVSVDITAPLYWWKEYDTYKVATVANSTSTMHRIHTKRFRLDHFSHDQLSPASLEVLKSTIAHLEALRVQFRDTRDKAFWWDIIQLLPSSYNQMRTCTFNYENLRGMVASRRGHKLDEWRKFCAWAEELPYARELILPPGGEA